MEQTIALIFTLVLLGGVSWAIYEERKERKSRLNKLG